MGQYRLSIEFKYQIGLNIEINKYSHSIDISLPFVLILIATDKYASGINIFGKITE